MYKICAAISQQIMPLSVKMQFDLVTLEDWFIPLHDKARIKSLLERMSKMAQW